MNRVARGAFQVMLAILVTVDGSFGTPRPADAQSAASGFEAVQSSIVRVWAFDAKGTVIASGTGFVVASDSSRSSIVTAAHVIKSATLIRVDAPDAPGVKAVVIKKEDANDIVLLGIDRGNLSSATFAFRQLDVGDTIAASGFYRSETSAGSQLPRLLYPGTISAMLRDDRTLAFDNLNVQEGLSGGPIFDATTGAVLGMVVTKSEDGRIGGYAVSAPIVIIGFLRSAGVHVAIERDGSPPRVASAQIPPPAMVPTQPTTAAHDTPAQRSDGPAGTLHALPGAGAVVVLYDTSRSTGANTPSAIAQAAADFANKLAAAFHVRVTTRDAQFPTLPAAARLIHDADAIVGVTYGTEFHSLSSFTNAYGTYTKWEFGLQSAIIDSYGMPWFNSGKFTKTVTSARAIETAITSSLADLNDQNVAALARAVNASGDDSVATNLFRYALPIANGSKKAFISLTPAARGAKAIVFPISAALQAGLQNGDLVLALNGTPTAGKTQAELTAMLLTASSAGPYDVVVETVDGTQQHIHFESEDLRWYVEHRTALSR